MTHTEAVAKAKQTAALNHRPFAVVQVVYMNGEEGWDVTPLDSPASIGRIGGSSHSRAKTKAARLNGAKGGRPKHSS